MNWFLFGTVLLYAGGAVYEVVVGHPWKAAVLAGWSISNFCFMWVGE